VNGRRWRYYGSVVLLSAGWYAVLWYLGPGFADFPGGVHLIGAAVVCGSLLGARLARSFLSRTRGPRAILAGVLAVVLGWVLSLTAYAVFLALSSAVRVHQLPSLTFIPWAVMVGAVISGWMMAELWYVMVPALIVSLVVTCLAARTLRP